MEQYKKPHFADISCLSKKSCFIFDMDGTICLGKNPFPEARELIFALRAVGKRIVFFTNNANRTHEDMMKTLGDMGFEPRIEEMMTAGDATIDFLLRERKGKRVFLLGMPRQKEQFRAAGICLTEGENGADIVVSSFDKSMTYDSVTKACLLIRGGAEYLCTHPDINFPTEDTFIPDSGAIATLITASTGVTPRFFGKPYPLGMQLILQKTGLCADDLVMIGDRLYTDIAFGKRNGVTAVLVLTGETKREDLNAETIKEEEIPDIILPNLSPLIPLFERK